MTARITKDLDWVVHARHEENLATPLKTLIMAGLVFILERGGDETRGSGRLNNHRGLRLVMTP